VASRTSQTDEPRCEVFQTIHVVRQAERLTARLQMDVQTILRNVDADKDR
jgi:hypothetical protein